MDMQPPPKAIDLMLDVSDPVSARSDFWQPAVSDSLEQ
jgi:hypothetical protein